MNAYTGRSYAIGGYNGAFSWWPLQDRPGIWKVCGHDQFCADGYAVVDDFGTLVEVPA